MMKSQEPLGFDAGKDLFVQIIESARMLRTFADQFARMQGTTRAQWGLLVRLAQRDDMTQAELAEVLEVQPISLCRLVDRLVAQGLVERQPHPRDRRANVIVITSSGREAVAGFAPLAREMMSRVFVGLTPDQAEHVVETLTRIKANIREAQVSREADDLLERVEA